MPFCKKCGKPISNNAKFCDGCGTPVSDRVTEPFTTRQQEYAGSIRKCPSCGESIPSFTAICPSCGHEINSSRVSSSLKEFSTLINEADTAINSSPAEHRKGWKSWSKAKKFGWVILNLYTLCIPLVLYYLLPLLGIGGLISLTSEEKKKAQIITNYSFPNDRESILEGLLYIKAQMVPLTSSGIDRNTYRWIRIWKNKATQLYDRAEIMFKGDSIAHSAYTEILDSEKKVKRTLISKVVVATILVCIFAGFMYSRTGAGRSMKSLNASFEWPTSGIALQVPESPSNRGEITFNDDKNFWIEVRGINQQQYEEYIEACKGMGFTVESEKNSISYKAFNGEGYHISLIHSNSDTDLTIRVEAPEPMGNIQWPSSDIAKRLPIPKSSYGRIYWEADYGFAIYLGNTTTEDFREYSEACYNAGFSVNYKKGDTYFRADDSEGYHVNLEYRGNNVIFIRIDNPQKTTLPEPSNTQEPQSATTADDQAGVTTAPAHDVSTLHIKNFTFELPTYWEEEGSEIEYLQYYAEKGDKVVILGIGYPEETDDDYEVSFDGLYADNENMKKAVASAFDKSDVVSSEVFESQNGVKGILYHFTCQQKISWLKSIDASGYCFCFPSESDRRWFFVYYLETSNVPGNAYTNDYMALISSIKEQKST